MHNFFTHTFRHLSQRLNAFCQTLLFGGLVFLCASLPANAQSVANYVFTPTTATYTGTSGGTQLHGAAVDDAISAATNIGFDFWYNGIKYTQFMASSNGYITLGATGTNNGTNNLNTATAGQKQLLATLWDDLETDNTASGKYVNYVVTGTAPNRVLTVEWHRHRWNFGSADDVISFQCKLYETTNSVEFNYAQGAGIVVSGTASIGINSDVSNQYLSLNGSGALPTASSSVNTTNISNRPATNQLYRFAPPTQTPATGLSCSTVSNSQINLTWTDAAGELGYEIYYSTNPSVPLDGTSSYTNAAANATTKSITCLSSNTTYYFKVFARKEGLSTAATTTCTTAASCTGPSTQASSVSNSAIGGFSGTVTWVRGNGAGVIVVAYPGASAGTTPASPTTYTANTAYGSGTALGTGFVVYNGTGTSVAVTSLANNAQYTFVVYEYSGAGCNICYNSTTTATTTFTTTYLVSGGADVAISSGATANGAWSYSAGTYTFSPTTNNAVLNMQQVVDRLQGTGSVSVAGNVMVNAFCPGCSGATLGGDITVSAAITANLTSSTPLTLTLTAFDLVSLGNNTLTLSGGTTYPGGNLVANGPGGVTTSTGASSKIITTGSTNGNLTINVNTGNATLDCTLSVGNITTNSSGAGLIIFNDNGALFGNALYTGSTTLNAGTTRIGTGMTGSIPDGTAMTINSGASFDMNNNSETIGSLAGAGTVTSSTAGAITLTAGGNNTSTTFSGGIQNGSGTVSFTKTGTGTMNITNPSTYTGTTTLTGGGTLQYGIDNALNNSSNISLNTATFSTGATTGYGDDVGTLSTTSGTFNTINLGAGAHDLKFSGKGTIAGKVNITNYVVGGAAGRIFVGASALLTAGELDLFTFSINGKTTKTCQLASGQLIPKPLVEAVDGSVATQTGGTPVTFQQTGGVTGGVWSAVLTPAGVGTFNAATATFTPSATTAGNIVVTYTPAGSGCATAFTYYVGQNYYMDPINGNDANDGLTTSTRKETILGCMTAFTSPYSVIHIKEGSYPYNAMTNTSSNTYTNESLTVNPNCNCSIPFTLDANRANYTGMTIEGEGCGATYAPQTGLGGRVILFIAAADITIRNIKFDRWVNPISFINCPNATVENCTFHDAASQVGHGLSFEGIATQNFIASKPDLKLTVKNCQFLSNGLSTSGQALGQGLYINNNGDNHMQSTPFAGSFTASVTGTTFSCNYGNTGGAMYVTSTANYAIPNVTIDGCSFANNEGRNGSGGGALSFNESYVTIKNTSFYGNKHDKLLTTGEGGAIQIGPRGRAKIDNCIFDSNVVGGQGAAIAVAGNLGTSCSISNSVFTNNTPSYVIVAGGTGRSVIRDNLGSTITNCLFKNNDPKLTEEILIPNYSKPSSISNTTFASSGVMLGINCLNCGTKPTFPNVVEATPTMSPATAVIDALGHAWIQEGSVSTALGFTGAYSTVPTSTACPTASATCSANAGTILNTSSPTSNICGSLDASDLTTGGTISITNVSGFVLPNACNLNTYRYYFLIVGSDGLIKKVISGDADADGTPDFAETPAISTHLDLSGLVPGTFTIQGFYTSTGAAPALGTTSAAAVTVVTGSGACASLTGGLYFKNCLTIRGTVRNDGNGLTNSLIDGTAINGTAAGPVSTQLYVSVMRNGAFVQAVPVAANGTYIIYGINPMETGYTLALTSTSGGTTASLPNSTATNTWFSEGETFGQYNAANTTAIPVGQSDGTASGTVNAGVSTNDVITVDLGINKRPVVGTATANDQTNPGGTTSVAVAALTAAGGGNLFSASDYETTISSITITSFPANATSFTSGATTYYPNAAAIPVGCGTCADFSALGSLNISTNSAGIPNSLAIDPAFATTGTVSFSYTTTDAANRISASGMATIPFIVPLPVRLLSFVGTIKDQQNILTWATASEENTALHSIERSINGQTEWQEISAVRAAGTTSTQHNYTLTDSKPFLRSYYRLRSLDFDGTSSLSAVILLERKPTEPTSLATYPNPATDWLRLDYELTQTTDCTLRLMDELGRVLQTLSIPSAKGLNTYTLNLKGYPAATYWISIDSSANRKMAKIVKVD